jgi:hypothetical protein
MLEENRNEANIMKPAVDAPLFVATICRCSLSTLYQSCVPLSTYPENHDTVWVRNRQVWFWGSDSREKWVGLDSSSNFDSDVGCTASNNVR